MPPTKSPKKPIKTQRYHLIRQAASVAQQLDNQRHPADIEVAIETAVAQLRQQLLQPPPPED